MRPLQTIRLRSIYGNKHLVHIALMVLTAAVVIAPLAISTNSTEAQTTLPDSNDTAATGALALVNQWRIQQGLMPLELNPLLQKMALDQANYVLPRYNTIENEEQYHHDAKDRSPITRAIEVLNWPNYTLPERVEVGENAAEFNVKSAVKFWQESPIHRKTATNPTYREVGIVALPLPVKGTYLFYINFGARPNKLTVMISPEGGTLYLSRETSRYSKDKDITPTVQIFDSNRQPLTEAMPYASQMTTPAGAGDIFFVKYVVGTKELWTSVDRSRDTVILPGAPLTVQQQLLAVKVSQDVSASVPTAAPIAGPSTTPSETPILPPTLPIASNTPFRSSQGLVPATNTPRFVAPPATNTPVDMGAGLTPTVVPSAVPTVAVVAGQADLTIYYDNKSLFVFNSANRPLPLDGLKVGRLSITAWSSLAPLPARGLPIGNCLGIGVGATANPTAPGVYKYVWAVINVSVPRAFWTTAPFDVSYNGVLLQTCVVADKQCGVKLP